MTLSARLWKRGLNPHLVKRSGANMVRSLVNTRGQESLAEYREYRKRNPTRDGYALRHARYAIAWMRLMPNGGHWAAICHDGG